MHPSTDPGNPPQQAHRPPTVPGYATLEPTKAAPWHRLVIADVLLNNLTTGLFLAAALADLAVPTTFAAVARVAYPVALALLIADLVCLVLDLGDPLRFHHMLRVFKPSSPMSLGTWCLTAYSLPLTVVVAVDLFLPDGTAHRWVHTLAVVGGLLPALGSAVYKGVLFSTSSQPGWKNARWLGGYLANSALMLGCAELLALSVLTGQDRSAAVLRPALGLLLALNVIPLGLLLMDVRPELRRIFLPRQVVYLAFVTIATGLVLPMALMLSGTTPALTLSAVFLVALGSLLVRFVIVMIPHGTRQFGGDGG